MNHYQIQMKEKGKTKIHFPIYVNGNCPTLISHIKCCHFLDCSFCLLVLASSSLLI